MAAHHLGKIRCRLGVIAAMASRAASKEKLIRKLAERECLGIALVHRLKAGASSEHCREEIVAKAGALWRLNRLARAAFLKARSKNAENVNKNIKFDYDGMASERGKSPGEHDSLLRRNYVPRVNGCDGMAVSVKMKNRSSVIGDKAAL